MYCVDHQHGRFVTWLQSNDTHAKGQTSNLIRRTKRRFFRDKIDETKGNPKGIWKELKSLSGTSKPRVRSSETVTENVVVSNVGPIVNELNKYFVNLPGQRSWREVRQHQADKLCLFKIKCRHILQHYFANAKANP